MRSKQYFTSIKNNPHEISTDPQKQNTSPLQVSKKRAPIRSLTMGALTTQKLN